MYVIQLNGEPHYVQATSAVLSAAGSTGTTAITLNQSDLPANTYIQQTHLEPQIQTVQQPATATVIHQQTDAFQDVIDYVQNLYADLAKEKHFSTYFCLFCSQEFVDLRLLLRHTSYGHRTKILDGTTNLDQDFEALVRKKLELKEQQTAAANQQLYQCVQCQQMFNSLDVISEHLNHCQVASTATNVLQTASVTDNVTTADNLTYQPKIEVPEPKPAVNTRDHYVPYGCAQCKYDGAIWRQSFHSLRLNDFILGTFTDILNRWPKVFHNSRANGPFAHLHRWNFLRGSSLFAPEILGRCAERPTHCHQWGKHQLYTEN